MKVSFSGILVWFVITLFVIYGFFLNTAGAVFAGTIKSSLNLTDSGAAASVGSFIIGFALMQIPAGYLLDRFNIRNVVASGLFLLAFGNLALTHSTTLPLFCISNFVQGIGASFAFLAAGKLISQWFAPRLFPIMFGLTQSLSCVLAAIIHYKLVMALQTMTWQNIYLKLSVFGFVLLVLALIVVKSPKKGKDKTKPLSLSTSLGMVFKNTQVWLCAICAATSFGVLAAYGSFWYLNVQKFYSVDTTNSLIISGLVFAGIGIGTPLLGWISNKLKSRHLVIHFSLVLGAIFLILGLYLPHFNINNFFLIQTVSFFIGVFLSGAMLFYTCASELATDQTRAVALGVINTAVFIFNSLLLFIPRLFITNSSESFFTYLWILPVCVLVSILISYFVKETYQKA